MKQKDLAVILLCVVLAAIFSFVICSKVIFTTDDRMQKVEVVAPITSDFKLPDNKVFNDQAVNPTKLIEIGPNTNNQPFANQ